MQPRDILPGAMMALQVIRDPGQSIRQRDNANKRGRLMFGRMAGSWSGLAAITAALGAVAPAAPAAAQDTITRPVAIYVAGTAGGGIDLYARVVGRHLGRHIPGNPLVTVQVMPGAGGIRAANFLAQQAPKDGTAMTTFAGGPILEPLIGARDPGYDMSQFTWVG